MKGVRVVEGRVHDSLCNSKRSDGLREMHIPVLLNRTRDNVTFAVIPYFGRANLKHIPVAGGER